MVLDASKNQKKPGNVPRSYWNAPAIKPKIDSSLGDIKPELK